jgi:hypothetical protein
LDKSEVQTLLGLCCGTTNSRANIQGLMSS